MSMKWFQTEGLLNRDTPDIGELADRIKRELRAYCDSKKCSFAGKRIHKVVPSGTSRCQDCGMYLFWKWATVAPLDPEKSENKGDLQGIPKRL